jgi:hypothetical protein
MIAKGHDFRRITLVASINADSGLFASDYRAPERLFALLMQAAGRAGRDAAQSAASEMWVQTWYPQHPLFASLKQHDFPAFAITQLAERLSAGMPPYGHQALLRADARSQQAAQAWLNAAAQAAVGLPHFEDVALYPAVPLTIQRVANVERAQLLLPVGLATGVAGHPQPARSAWPDPLCGGCGPAGDLTCGSAQVIRATAAENVKKAAAVVTRMMRAMRPLSAPKRSASKDTLLALGSAAASTITVSAAGESGTPSWIAAVPTTSTSSGCSSSFISATGT